MTNQAIIPETSKLPAYEAPPPQYELGDPDKVPEKVRAE